MTTTFKVVEFYRNNNNNNNNNNNANNTTNHNFNSASNLLNATSQHYANKEDPIAIAATSSIKKSYSSSNANHVAQLIKSANAETDTNNHAINNNSHIFSSLGFNVIGGYLTDIPATIIDIDCNTTSSNGKQIKVKARNKQKTTKTSVKLNHGARQFLDSGID